jgi:glycosyltransferase involved in cell wall biosynthesis
MRPSLGVLITYHNEGRLLAECLDTLLAQSDRPDEILIFDDASSDPAEKHVEEGRQGVRILRGEKNMGAGLARNELLRLSRSDFIHFQDADDFFDPSWCGSVRAAIDTGEADIILNNVSAVDAAGTAVIASKLYNFHGLFLANDLTAFFLTEYTNILVAMTTFRREAALSAGGFLPRETLTFAEDFEFHIRLFAQGSKFKVIPDALVIKRRRPDSLSRDGSRRLRPEVFTDAIKSLQLIGEWLPSRYQCFLPDLFCRRGASLFRIGRRREARLAFRQAREWGKPLYRSQPWAYRTLARTFGPELPEWTFLFYSRWVPSKLRSRIKSAIPS